MRWRLKVEDDVFEVRLVKMEDESFIFEVDGQEIKLSQPHVYPYSIRTNEVSLAIESWSQKKWRAVDGSSTVSVESIGFGKASQEDQDTIQSQMPGRILKVLVQPGEKVKADQTLLIVEAMKMENEIRATSPAVVKEVKVQEGDSIESGTLLIRFESSK